MTELVTYKCIINKLISCRCLPR